MQETLLLFLYQEELFNSTLRGWINVSVRVRYRRTLDKDTFLNYSQGV